MLIHNAIQPLKITDYTLATRPFTQWKKRQVPALFIFEIAGIWFLSYAAVGISSFPFPVSLTTLLTALLASFRLLVFDRSLTALVIGTGEAAERVRRRIIAEHAELEMTVAGFIPISRGQDSVPRRLILHTTNFRALMMKCKYDVILVAPDEELPPWAMHELLDCKLEGIDLICESDLCKQS